MKTLDRPENSSVIRNVVRQVKGIMDWHRQIDELIKELGVAITGDPDFEKKLDAVGKAAKAFE